MWVTKKENVQQISGAFKGGSVTIGHVGVQLIRNRLNVRSTKHALTGLVLIID